MQSAFRVFVSDFVSGAGDRLTHVERTKWDTVCMRDGGRSREGTAQTLGSEGLKRDDEEMGVSFLHCKTNKTR